MEPHSLVGGMGEGGWSGRGLACGLQDQRLMARPPARAGGRSGSLTGGKSGKRNGFSPPFPKGYLSTSPARPAGGRAATGLSLGGPQARYPVRGTASPTQLHQRRESRGKNLFPLGFFPPFLPKKWGPGRAGQGSLPFQRRRKKPATPPARESQLPHPLQQRRELPLPPSPGIWYTEVTTTACPPRQATGRDRLCSATVLPWAPAARWGRCAGTA